MSEEVYSLLRDTADRELQSQGSKANLMGHRNWRLYADSVYGYVCIGFVFKTFSPYNFILLCRKKMQVKFSGQWKRLQWALFYPVSQTTLTLVSSPGWATGIGGTGQCGFCSGDAVWAYVCSHIINIWDFSKNNHGAGGHHYVKKGCSFPTFSYFYPQHLKALYCSTVLYLEDFLFWIICLLLWKCCMHCAWVCV